MRFGDSSAIVPLVVEERASRACRTLLRADPTQIVWSLTRIEVVSAIQRLTRVGELSKPGRTTALHRLESLASRWIEVTALDDVRFEAARLLGAHPLTAADAAQLGAAIVASKRRPAGRFFITRDHALFAAAEAERFTALDPGA